MTPRRGRLTAIVVTGVLVIAALSPAALGGYLEGLFDDPKQEAPAWGALFGVGRIGEVGRDPASRAGAPGEPVAVAPDPAPELALAEPDYGDVPEAQVRLASAVLELTAPPLQLTTEEARSLVREAEQRLEAVMALTGTRFSPGDLLGAATALGLEVGTAPDEITSELLLALELDLAALRAAAAGELRPTLLSFGIEPASDEPEDLAEAMRTALGRLGAPVPPAETLDLDDVRWLRALANVEDAAARWNAGPVTAPLAAPTWTSEGQRAETIAAGVSKGGPVATQVRQLGDGGVLYQVRGGPPGSPVSGWLVVFDPRRAGVRAAPSGTLGSTATVASAAQRTGALVAVNGGFWLGRGDPDGLLVNGDAMLSDPTAWVRYARNQRAGFGILPDGTPLVGVPQWDALVGLPDTLNIPVRGVNRLPEADDVVLLTSSGSSSIPEVDGVAIVVEGTRLMVGGERDLRIVRSGEADTIDRTLQPGTMALVATGRYAERAQRVVRAASSGRADSVRIRVDVGAGWSGATAALNAGPLTLTDGRATGTAQWRSEGFDANHTDKRHPRTALGFDDAGIGYLLVLDGRQPRWSVGATQLETAAWLRAFGATAGLQLDGGGSSTLVVDGDVINRPCCDGGLRPVSTVLLIQ